MKIIHLNHSDDSGGAARAAYRIHHSLLKNAINSQMWVNRAGSGDLTVIEPISKITKLLNEFRPRLISRTLNKMLKTENKIIHSPSVLSSCWLKNINNSDADIVHLHWIQNEMLSIKDISEIKKPIVWTLHDMWAFCGAEHYTYDNRWREGYYNNRPNYETGFDLNRWTWKRKKKYWKNSIQIITPSNWLAKCVAESSLMKNWPISVIPYPIDTNFWKPLDKKIARVKLNLDFDGPLILFGSMYGGKDPRKGYDLLLSAIKSIKSKNSIKKLGLVIFGEDKPKSKLDHGFSIHYAGHLYDNLTLRALYNAADVVVVPSRQDNLPLVAIEAQTCGTPVVSFDINGLPDVIEHQKTGYLAKPYDIKDLANGINWVLEESDSMQICKNARKLSIEKFSEKKIAESYLSIYKKILNG